MLRDIIRSILALGDGQFESYYQRVLETTSPETAPSASEARADFLRMVRRYQHEL